MADEATAPVSAPTEQDRIAKLEAERVARQQARENAEAKRKVLELELEARFEQEIGPRGIDFEIVSSSKGTIVLKRGEAVTYKTFISSKVEYIDVQNYVRPCIVFPDATAALAILEKHPGLWNQCALALHRLYGAENEDKAGK